MLEYTGKYTKAIIMTDQYDEGAVQQIFRMINHEAFINLVVIMPDYCPGKGSVIGFTMKVTDKVIPNIVGVDISCGMLSYNIGNIEFDCQKLDDQIRETIPFGTNVNTKEKVVIGDELKEICKRIKMSYDYALKSVGTLGGGNHFLEIGKSVNTGDIWITIHSGSRNFGKKVCEYWQDVASKKEFVNRDEIIKKIKETFPKKEWQEKIMEMNLKIRKIKKSELDFLEGKNKDGYLDDMRFSQTYASLNRQTMMNQILSLLNNPVVKDKIETIHNYINFEDNIIRKGAIKSYIGQKMIIPLNMRDGILLCEGKSNPDWNFSAPHGSGRLFSRSEAKQTLDLEKFKKDMEDIFTTSVCFSTLDESPDAYKDSSMIIESISPTADIIDVIKPIHNMKDISNEKTWREKKSEKDNK